MIKKKEGYKKIISLLLSHGANVDAQTGHGRWTSLHIAVKNGHLELVEFLLEKGANITIKAADGLTAFHLAALYNHVKILRLLLERGVLINALSNDGYTALQYAAAQGYRGIVEFLLLNGADPTAGRKDGWTDVVAQAESNNTSKAEITDLVKIGRTFHCIVQIIKNNKSLKKIAGIEKHLSSPLFCKQIQELLAKQPDNLDNNAQNSQLSNKLDVSSKENENSLINRYSEKDYPIRLDENHEETFQVGLALDGEGLQALVTASMVNTIENDLNYPLYQLFDYIAGSSFGGLVALGLAASENGKSRVVETSDLVKLFYTHSLQMFKVKAKNTPFYKYEPLQKKIRQMFKHARMSDCLTRVLIPCKTVKPFDFDSSLAQKKVAADFYVRDIACATSIDPEKEYFPAVTMDGIGTICSSGDYRNKTADFLINKMQEKPDDIQDKKIRLVYCAVDTTNEGYIRIDERLQKMNQLDASTLQKSSALKEEIQDLKIDLEFLGGENCLQQMAKLEELETMKRNLSLPSYVCIKPPKPTLGAFDDLKLLASYKEQGELAAEIFLKQNEHFICKLKENAALKHPNAY